MIRRFLVAAFLASLGNVAFAQSGIQMRASHQVSVDNATRPHVESHVAVDPRDERHLLATSMVVGPSGAMRSYPYVSFDGGQSWTRGKLADDSLVVMEADPLVYITRTGASFFVALGQVHGSSRVVVRRSTDGGRTWNAGAVVSYADREWMAFDTSTASFTGRIYLTGTGVATSRDSVGVREVAPFLARSDDDGLSFPNRRFVGYDEGGSNPRAPLNAAPQEAFVTTRGLFGIALQQADDSLLARFAADSLNARRLGIMVSNDGGESFGASRFSTDYLLWPTGTAARRERSIAASGSPRSAVDLSPAGGRFRDRIYLAASSYEKRLDRFVVRVWHTSDLGRTWKSVVASDAPRGDVANPAIAVNRDGVVAVTWNDRRDDPQLRCWQLYAAISTDGGDTFRPAQRMSTRQTCANDAKNWITFGLGLSSTDLARFQSGPTIPARFPMGGDTQGLAADATGAFHAAWINGETGVMQLWHTSFTVSPELVQQLRSRPRAGASDDSVAAPPNMQEVTNDVVFRVLNTNLDFATHRWTIDVQLENRSGRSLRGPISIVMHEFLHDIDQGAGLKNLVAANADNGGRGTGALWRLDVAGGALEPGKRTVQHSLVFSFEGGVPERPAGYLTPGFRVYAPR